MKNRIIKMIALALVVICGATLGGCSGNTPTYEGFDIPKQEESTLKPVGKYYIEKNNDNVKPEKEKTIQTCSSKDGLCVIKIKPSYYDVTLDYEKGSSKKVGAAYAEAIVAAYPGYPKMLEGYLFENIRAAFGGTLDDFSALQERVDTLKGSLDKIYQDEMEGFADAIKTTDESGFKEDGKLSREEAILINMVPDALRPTACSAVTVNGNITSTKHRMTARILEWNLGSDNQLSSVHCVTHFKNGEKSFTSIGFLGMMDILTAVNKDGLVIGELDVGSASGQEFTCEGKTCYSYGLRYSIENFATAKEAGQYLIDNSSRYTYCVNILLTDDKNAYSAELSVTEADGHSVLRDSSTPLNDGLEWNSKDCLGMVNSFAAKGNADLMTATPENLVRWKKFNELFCSEDNITLNRFKELLTCEKTEDSPVINFRGDNLVHMVVFDYDTHSIQAILNNDKQEADNQKFVDLGTF